VTTPGGGAVGATAAPGGGALGAAVDGPGVAENGFGVGDAGGFAPGSALGAGLALVSGGAACAPTDNSNA
jgi:hypothetical protein